jgi:adiponectin receptor
MIHLFSATFCLGCSALYHLMQVHSLKVNGILHALDHGGISVLICGSCYPLIYYEFACPPVFWYRNFFLALITTTSLITFLMTMSPQMLEPKYRSLRASLFVILGLSTGIPFAFKMFFLTDAYTPYILPRSCIPSLALGGAAYIAGAITYAKRFPERWYPNRFDLFGHSHSIFHVAILFGCAIHLNESMILFLTRKEMVCPLSFPG